VTIYSNAISNYGGWITDRAILTRVRELAREGGVKLVEDVIWHEREPWTKTITAMWPAVDTFSVELLLDEPRP
jgi:hypothetical protein